jgi:hypothetical protein
MKFIVEQGGKQLAFTPSATTFKDDLPGATHWTTVLKNPDVNITVHGTAEFDGFMGYQLDVTLQMISIFRIYVWRCQWKPKNQNT